ncbi:MAG: hypothetical protein LBG72_09505 [Spirochaetaceae bacterium]|jgi:hypothetical protein|nr:hypothetical protein [Spirochaetaceae bacterium]
MNNKFFFIPLFFTLFLASALVISFTMCSQLEGMLLPVKEPPRKVSLKGKVIFDQYNGQNVYENYKALKVHIYRNSDSEYIAGAAIQEDLTWSLEVTAEQDFKALFWVELEYKLETYYNGGSIDGVVDGMYYELHITPYSDTIPAWRPLFNSDDLQKIGKEKAADGNYILVKNIDITEGWQPVGANGSLFRGTLYGRNNIIHFYGKQGDALSQYTGIFRRLDGAAINNLIIELHNVTAALNIQNDAALGILAGCIEGTSKINNVEITGGTLTVTKTGISEAYIGGIAGIVRGGAEIKNCVNNAEIACEVQEQSHTVFTGGIAGIIDGQAHILQCGNTGEIKVSNPRGNAAVGGVAGGIDAGADYSVPQIQDSYSSGMLSSQGEFSVCGGIAGMSRTYAHIKNCWSAGGASAVTIDGSSYSAGILALSTTAASSDKNRIHTCAVFKQTISAQKNTASGVLAAANRLSSIDCPDCESGIMVCGIGGCGCGGNTALYNLVDGAGKFSITEKDCVILVNGSPVPGKDAVSCHNGEIATSVSAYKLKESGWDFNDIWFWNADMTYPGLYRY